MPYFQHAVDARGRDRIICTENGIQRDVCGAVDAKVAWQQADILNRMHRNKPQLEHS